MFILSHPAKAKVQICSLLSVSPAVVHSLTPSQGQGPDLFSFVSLTSSCSFSHTQPLPRSRSVLFCQSHQQLFILSHPATAKVQISSLLSASPAVVHSLTPSHSQGLDLFSFVSLTSSCSFSHTQPQPRSRSVLFCQSHKQLFIVSHSATAKVQICSLLSTSPAVVHSVTPSHSQGPDLFSFVSLTSSCSFSHPATAKVLICSLLSVSPAVVHSHTQPQPRTSPHRQSVILLSVVCEERRQVCGWLPSRGDPALLAV